MSFFKSLFAKKEIEIKNYEDFWKWFQLNEKDFFNAVREGQKIERNFFAKLTPKLAELKEGFFFLTGMQDQNTAELILTADGNIMNIVFVEELVKAAPEIKGWKFTALKPATAIDNVSINMNGLKFNSENLHFYPESSPEYPDEIDICIVHDDMTDDNKQQIMNGSFIFLDNYLGELDFVNNIDNVQGIEKSKIEKELIPISKLKDYLIWRQKEFIEKYDGVRYDTQNDDYSVLEAELENGNPLLAVVNTNLLNWDSKASHPWVAKMSIQFDGTNSNGMPNPKDYELMSSIEDELVNTLADKDGYLNVGRQTANSEREIFFATKDFRRPSKVFYEMQQKYRGRFEIDFIIYKDKYWQTFDRFKMN